MKEQLSGIFSAIAEHALPSQFETLFPDCFDAKAVRFIIQETSVLDFKVDAPASDDKHYISGLLKLIISFHNSYGGVIVFGVRNDDFRVVGIDSVLDVELYNALITDIFGVSAELLKRDYKVIDNENTHIITVLLVPQRKRLKPARAERNYHRIGQGDVYLRERHEAIVARDQHIPFLFSVRPSTNDASGSAQSGVQASLPPSPATLPHFVGRFELSWRIWQWFIFGKNPRVYLSGAGGSGKSTLAYEFAEKVVAFGSEVRLPNNESIDYVLYLSAKETEFNVKTAEEQLFKLRQFSNADELYAAILIQSGMCNESELKNTDAEGKLELLDSLFDHFNGLIVIDDIDALSRSGVDTGEEDLFLKASSCAKKTRILYTLRNDAHFAKNASIPVPGLDLVKELPAFIDACCDLFQVPPPHAAQEAIIVQETSALPLLIETVMGLRKNSSNYDQAIRDFRERGGEGARRYLYQREYDKLDPRGKSRQVLAALMEYGGPMGFDVLSTLVSASPEQARDAINETASIFLKILTDGDGNTVYDLAPSAHPFVRLASRGLTYIGALKSAVEHLKSQTARSTPKEAAIIVKIEALIKQSRFNEAVAVSDDITADDPVRVNPRFMAVLGRAYVQCTPANLTIARELFRSAMNFGYSDIFMMRAWYYAEKNTGYRFPEAVKICEYVLKGSGFSNRQKSEFYSKLGDCLGSIAKGSQAESQESRAKLLSEAVIAYLKALALIGDSNDTDKGRSLEWLERAISNLVQVCRSDFSSYLRSIETLGRDGFDLDLDAEKVVSRPLIQVTRTSDAFALRKVRGMIGGSIAGIRRISGAKDRPGFIVFYANLEDILLGIEKRLIQLDSA